MSSAIMMTKFGRSLRLTPAPDRPGTNIEAAPIPTVPRKRRLLYVAMLAIPPSGVLCYAP
jgi:hypothetical protein